MFFSTNEWTPVRKFLVDLGGFGGCGVEEKAALMATVKRLKVILDNSATKDRDQVGSKLFTRKMGGVMVEKSHFQGELVLAP